MAEFYLDLHMSQHDRQDEDGVFLERLERDPDMTFLEPDWPEPENKTGEEGESCLLSD